MFLKLFLLSSLPIDILLNLPPLSTVPSSAFRRTTQCFNHKSTTELASSKCKDRCLGFRAWPFWARLFSFFTLSIIRDVINWPPMYLRPSFFTPASRPAPPACCFHCTLPRGELVKKMSTWIRSCQSHRCFGADASSVKIQPLKELIS